MGANASSFVLIVLLASTALEALFVEGGDGNAVLFVGGVGWGVQHFSFGITTHQHLLYNT